MSRHESEEFAYTSGETYRGLRGLARRMAVRLTKGVLWQLTGHKYHGHTETLEVEPFTGVGFYARPRPSSKAEAVAISIGDAQHTVIIATRDEDLRKLWAAELDAGADVAAMFSSATIVLCKADGTVEIRSRGGAAVSLAKKSDAEAAATWDANHIHLDGSGLPTSGPLAAVLPNPAFPGDPKPFIAGPSPGSALIDGTDVLKAE